MIFRHIAHYPLSTLQHMGGLLLPGRLEHHQLLKHTKLRQMLIRPFTLHDTEAVISLWKSCGLVAPQNNPHKDIERKLKVNPELFLIGEVNMKVIASVMGGYEGHRGWLNYLAVSPDHRHKGYGQQIVAAAEKRIAACGAPKINLQVRSTNTEVIKFYTSLGYGEDSVLSMGKRLVED